MADTRYFYYKKSMMGRWIGQISTLHPKDLLDKKMKLLREPVELKGENSDLGLRECELKWPVEPVPSVEEAIAEITKLTDEADAIINDDPVVDLDEVIADLKIRGIYDALKYRMLEVEL